MTLKEAYKTLGASKQDDNREIKAKYKKQWFPVFDYACECRDGDIW